MLLLLELSKDLRIVALVKKFVLKNLVMVFVFLINGVEENVASFTVFSIYLPASYTYFKNSNSRFKAGSTSINMNKLAKACNHGSNLWELVHRHMNLRQIAFMDII